MILSKKFLQSVLPHASFFIGVSAGFDEHSFDAQDTEVGVSIDSRTLESQELFFAVKGAVCDGNDFIAQALERGACGVVTERYPETVDAKLLAGKIVIVVADVLEALIALARAWRAQFTIPIVGITGSIGKTTTKEMTRSILQAAGVKSFVSYKNQNNIIGLCLNILKMHSDVAVGVFEVSLYHKGVIAKLADILRPTIGLITRLAHAHIQHVGSLTDIAREKQALFTFFENQHVGIVFGDQPLLSNATYKHPIAKFGFKMKNLFQARKVSVEQDEQGLLSTSFMLTWYHKKVAVRLRGNHQGLVHNALAASTLAYFLQIPLEAVVSGLAAYQSFENRYQFMPLKTGRGQLISDCYNANPESVRAALNAFHGLKVPDQKIAVLGDMLELGQKEAYWHRQVGRMLCKTASINQLILVGDRASLIAKTAPRGMFIEYAADWQAALRILENKLAHGNPSVLVKGSRGMQLDKLVEVVAGASAI